jgi:hypothetical protein
MRQLIRNFIFSTIFVYEDLPDMMYMDPSEGLFDTEIRVPGSEPDEFDSLDDASRSPRQLQEKFIRPDWRDYQNSQACYTYFYLEMNASLCVFDLYKLSS